MRIAHISDLHAFTLDGATLLSFCSKRLAGGLNLIVRRRNYTLQLFSALVDDLNRLDPDHIVVTGDVTSLSLDGEFAAARRMFDRLALGPERVTIVPGNHDAYVWTAYLGRSFERAFAPYLGELAGAASPYPLVQIRGGLAIVGVSTVYPSPVPLADGWVGGMQLERIAGTLRTYRDKFRLVALHHPPLKNRRVLLRGLRDRASLCAVLAQEGAELVLHGHEHRDLWQYVAGPDGPIPIVGVGSGTLDDPRPDRRARYNVYEIDGKMLTAAETRVHDAARGCFTVQRRRDWVALHGMDATG